MYITISSIITICSLVSAVIGIFAIIFKVHKWYLKQEKQDNDIAKLNKKHDADMHENKAELRIICKSLLACLDGLEQLGCNHSVPKSKKELEDHINKVAHK